MSTVVSSVPNNVGFLSDPTVTKWSRLVEKSLAKHKIDLQKTTNNAKSVFLQLAKKDSTRKQKLAQVM